MTKRKRLETARGALEVALGLIDDMVPRSKSWAKLKSSWGNVNAVNVELAYESADAACAQLALIIDELNAEDD